MINRQHLPPCIGLAALILLLLVSRAGAQLNSAYDNGYKPMLDLSGKLNDLASSEEKRDDYDAVKDLGSNYMDKLDKMISAFDTAGKDFEDGDNKSWIGATCSAVKSSAKNARAKAEALQKKGDAKQNCHGQVIDLQKALADLSDDFKKCQQEHEARNRKVMDDYTSTVAKFGDMSKDDGIAADQGKKNEDARNKLNDLQAKATEASRAYTQAFDLCEKARTDFRNVDMSKSNDEFENRYKAWTDAEKIRDQIGQVCVKLDKDVKDADANYADTRAALDKAMDDKMKGSKDLDDMAFILRGRWKRAYEMNKEYKPFSM